jgi:hypothetical protein
LAIEFNEYSPILVGVYNRLAHFKQCIDSLSACPEAKFSVLYIASDAAYRDEDIDSVIILREYIATIDGFKEVIPILRDENVGALLNYSEAIKEITENHETFIVMEDDVVVGQGFLHFMNQGLKMYCNHPEIIGVAGYLPPNIENTNGSPFFLKNLAPYGCGFWSDKFIKLEKLRTVEFFDHFYKDFEKFKEYEKMSPHVARAVPRLIHSAERFGDIEIEIVMLCKGYLALYPPTAISKSIGHDGTGIHSGQNPLLQGQVISNIFYKIETGQKIAIEFNEEIQNKISNQRRHPFVFVINYMVFVFNKFIPGYFYLYSSIRKLVRNLR